MSNGRAGIGDFVRKIVSFVLLAAAVIALIFFFAGASSTIGEPFKAAFDGGFDWSLFSKAVYDALIALAMPLIMLVLGLIGLTVDK